MNTPVAPYNQIAQPVNRLVPLMLENLQEFFIGNRLSLRVQVTKPGELGKGILDYGTVLSAEGAQFEGYLAAIRFNEDNMI